MAFDYKKISKGLLWYLVGLIATDGCLHKDGRHINVTSHDREFLYNLTLQMNWSGKVGIKRNGFDGFGYQIQIGSVHFHKFLKSLGLTPKKSLSLGKLKVPDKYFSDFLRGVIDGDGNIYRWIHPQNKKEQWCLRIYSCSEKFIRWLFDKICSYFSVKGILVKTNEDGKSTKWTLKFGKLAAQEIFKHCYENADFSLPRKANLAYICTRSRTGWSKSKTINIRRGVEIGKRS